MSTILTDTGLANRFAGGGMHDRADRDKSDEFPVDPIELDARVTDRVPLHRINVDQARAADGEALVAEIPILLAVVRAISLNDAEAEDVVSATIEIALRHLGELRDPAAIRPWLLRIGTREAFRLRRRLARFVPLGIEEENVSVGFGSNAESVAVRSALQTLPPRVRAAVVLHHMVGLPVGEVAAALGTSPNTVKAQLRTGLARMREELGDD